MKAAKIIILLWTAFCIWGALYGFSGLDPDRIQESDAYAAGAGLGLFLWVMIWGILVVPIALIGMLFRKKETGRRGVETGDRVKCPFCAELIRREAKVCPHCQRDLGEAPKPAVPASVRRDWEKADRAAPAVGRQDPKPPKM